MNDQSKGGQALTAEQLAAIEARDLRHRDGRTLMKDVAEGGRDRSALLSHISATAAERDRLQAGWNEAFKCAVFHQDRAEKTEAQLSALQGEVERLREAATHAEQLCDSISDMKPGKFSTEACAETALTARNLLRAALAPSAAKGEQEKCGTCGGFTGDGIELPVNGYNTFCPDCNDTGLATPEHAPAAKGEQEKPYKQCSVCGRKSWDEPEIQAICWMPQPTGDRCQGVLRQATPERKP